MKTIIFIALSILFFSFQIISDFYGYRFTTIEGAEKQMDAYRGIKILILVLPGTIRESDTTYLKAINDAGVKHKGQLTMIAVPSLEDGYTSSATQKLKQWYGKYMDSDIIITEGMYTQKTSPAQHAIFSWLTDKNKNGHFDLDVKGVGHKFLINEEGELNGVSDPQAPLSDRLLGLMLNK